MSAFSTRIEHTPWRPKRLKEVAGQRIAIVGYSHHRRHCDLDRANFTNEVIQGVIAGELDFSFFNSIRDYFGYESHEDFWNRVLFFNFLPNCIGMSSDKFGRGTHEQTELAKSRVLRILSANKPSKVFVFTRKGWCDFPPTIEEQTGHRCRPLVEGSKEPSWGTYHFGESRVLACGFRHPQGAQRESLREQVHSFLNMR
jgi:hypothetical protein